MVSSVQEAPVVIRDLLDNNWDSTNTQSIKPTIVTGWWNETRDQNMVTISGTDETAIGGGRTGYFGTQSNAGPVKDIDGSAQIDCWSDADQFTTSSTSAKNLVWDFSEEVKRIITNNTIKISEFRYLSWMGRTELPSLDESPTVERQSCNVSYSYYILP
jgi:hypothetical protein